MLMKRVMLTIVCTGLFVFGSSVTSSAFSIINPDVRLDVTYTDGGIVSGPLSFGLRTLPSEVNARFQLGPGSSEPGEPTIYGLGDVSAAEVSFGDGLWTVLSNFSMEVTNGIVNTLSYEFSAINTARSTGGIVLNFPLTITGTDTALNTAFEYQYGSSTQTISSIDPVPEPATIALLGIGLAGLAGGAARRRWKNKGVDNS